MINNYIKKTLQEEKTKLEFENISNQKQVESFTRLSNEAKERLIKNSELIQQINDLIEHLDQSQNIPYNKSNGTEIPLNTIYGKNPY